MKPMTALFALLFVTGTLTQAQPYPTDPRSDSVDIRHITLHLDLTDLAGKSLQANAELEIISKVPGLASVPLDLLKLAVDSVLVNGSPAQWSYNDTLLRVSLASPLNSGDSAQLTVVYHGQPQKDASGWGGFYFQNNFAFNLGVGFAADPHPYGRVWFPCLDNFTERFTMEQYVTTQTGFMAVCGGILLDTMHLPSGNIIWHWRLDQEIPSYLASVAVGPYTIWSFSFAGQSDTFPVWIAALPSDTGKLAGSFQHLDEALEAFEQGYGPYSWPRTGYVLVPFNSGAMEHATNIAYPRLAVNGTTNLETLFAHELSHHWWGDLVTCRTAEDMWINEGWASWSEYLFLEYVYGRQAYENAVRVNHREVLQFAHVEDGAWLPVSGVGHGNTYGTTVYDKGADMVHNLRTYLGDSLFFSCIRQLMSDSAFTDISTNGLRDYLSQCSGKDLTDYFNDWIFQPGWLHFSIDSTRITQDGSQWRAEVYIRQRLDHAQHYGQNIPLRLTFMDKQWQKLDVPFEMSGRCGIYHATLSFKPDFVALNMDHGINDAVTAQQVVLEQTGTYNLNEAMIDFTVSAPLPDSVLLWVEHHWVPPDPFQNPHPGLHLSDYRFWRVDGLFDDPLPVKARIRYNGTNSTLAGYLDNGLITNSEDSLVLLWRTGPGHEWTEYPDYTLNTVGSPNNKFGIMDIEPVRKGEYTLAIWDHNRPDTMVSDQPPACYDLNTGLHFPNRVPRPELHISPNPAGNETNITLEGPGMFDLLLVYDTTGNLILSQDQGRPVAFTRLVTGLLLPGTYHLEVQNHGVTIATGKLVIVH